ncbi:MAG: protein kinase [Acidimicrobiales bacterium]
MSEPIDLGIDDLDDARPIGRGGFSVVYAATDSRFGRPVAVKVLTRALDEDDQRRFDRECLVMGKLSAHPNVVDVYRAGTTTDGRPYLVMELMEQGTVADRLADGPLPWVEAVELIVAVADAVAVAHEAGILHRDIKPENILLAADGPRLTDFGIAYLRDSTASTSTQITASWLHTPPETFDNQRDERSDIYSLASTLFTMIAGRAPFWNENEDSLNPLLRRLLTQPAPDLPETLAPQALNAIVQRALAKDPGERQTSARQFAAELAALDPTGAGNRPAAPPRSASTVVTDASAAAGAGPAASLASPASPAAAAGAVTVPANGASAETVAERPAHAATSGTAAPGSFADQQGPASAAEATVAAAPVAPRQPLEVGAGAAAGVGRRRVEPARRHRPGRWAMLLAIPLVVALIAGGRAVASNDDGEGTAVGRPELAGPATDGSTAAVDGSRSSADDVLDSTATDAVDDTNDPLSPDDPGPDGDASTGRVASGDGDTDGGTDGGETGGGGTDGGGSTGGGSTDGGGSDGGGATCTAATVPAVKGQTVGTAKGTLSTAGFEPTSGAADSLRAEGSTPAAGTSSCVGDPVQINACATTTVPVVANRVADDVLPGFASQSLTVNKLFEESSTVGNGVVIRTSPAGGTTVCRGTTVNVTVSTGAPACFTLPNVLGMTGSQARATLEATSSWIVVLLDYGYIAPGTYDVGQVFFQGVPGGTEVKDCVYTYVGITEVAGHVTTTTPPSG